MEEGKFDVMLEAVSASSSAREGSSGIARGPGAKGFCVENRLLVDDATDLLDEGGEYGKRAEDVEDQSSEAVNEVAEELHFSPGEEMGSYIWLNSQQNCSRLQDEVT